MNAATYTIYPNEPLEFSLAKKVFSVTWKPESDEILVSTAKSKRSLIENPNRLDLVKDPQNSRSQSTYCVSFENSNLKLKYLDGHRVQSIRVQ